MELLSYTRMYETPSPVVVCYGHDGAALSNVVIQQLDGRRNLQLLCRNQLAGLLVERRVSIDLQVKVAAYCRTGLAAFAITRLTRGR
jgi:hypothetical protein